MHETLFEDVNIQFENRNQCTDALIPISRNCAFTFVFCMFNGCLELSKLNAVPRYLNSFSVYGLYVLYEYLTINIKDEICLGSFLESLEFDDLHTAALHIVSFVHEFRVCFTGRY